MYQRYRVHQSFLRTVSVSLILLLSYSVTNKGVAQVKAENLDASSRVTANTTTTESDAQVLRRFPPGSLHFIAQLIPLSRNGLAGRNKSGWMHVRFQMGATFFAAIACLLGDREHAEEGWRAIDVSFQHQKPDGSFVVGDALSSSLTERDNVSGVAFFTARLCQSLMLIQDSPLAAEYGARVRDLMPRLRLTADYLKRGASELAEADRLAPNRKFFDAQAFAYSGLLLHDQELVKTGNQFLQSGLAMQMPDGAFDEKGGGDSSYQAVSLTNLQSYVLYYPSRRLQSSIAKGIVWEMPRILSTGEVTTEGNSRVKPGGESFFGKEKEVDYQDVIMALLYYGTTHNDERVLHVADRVISHVEDHYKGSTRALQ
jgi:hypothetical protein